ncbi:MAG: metallophosphoesterase [Tenericutes bacterium]|nr:metallophosphoesterase [Mycoplasmatota bacterium]
MEKYLEDTNNIDSIIVPGDLVNGANSYLNSEYLAKLNYILEMLGQKAPTIVSRGNHDVWNGNDEISKIFKNLDKIKNVYPLDNEQENIDGVTYTGFSPRFDAYNIMNVGKKANKMFEEDWKKCDFHFKNGNLNILLAHDPITMSSDESLNSLNEDFKNITMIGAGHLHNGFITTKHEQKRKLKLQDKGIWESPLTGFKINNCRGAYFIGNNTRGQLYLPEQDYYKVINGYEEKDKALLVITKGFSKYPLSKIGGDPNITEIELSNSKVNYIDDEKNIKSNIR